jgi:hypothetical protein
MLQIISSYSSPPTLNSFEWVSIPNMLYVLYLLASKP